MNAYIPVSVVDTAEIVPGLPIRWYGLMYLVAFVITYLLFTYQLRERKQQPQKDLVLDMFFWGIIGLLIGARAFAVTIYDPTGYYLHHPLQIILPFAVEGGFDSRGSRACPITAAWWARSSRSPPSCG